MTHASTDATIDLLNRGTNMDDEAPIRYRNTGFYIRNSAKESGQVDILDYLFNVVKRSVPYAEAEELISNWMSGQSNPYDDL